MPTRGNEALELRVERKFYTLLAAAILVAVLFGFARSFFLRPWFSDFAALHTPPEAIFYLHGATVALWFLLLIVQIRLVANRHVSLHRRLGWAAVALAGAIVLLGVEGSRVAARRPGGITDVPLPPLEFLAVPLFDLGLFALFFSLAVLQRKAPQAHKRWMLLASIGILSPAVVRWPLAAVAAGGAPLAFAITDLFLVPLLLWDLRTRRRPHPVTVVGGLLLVASQPLRLMISGTEPWLRFAAWLVG